MGLGHRFMRFCEHVIPAFPQIVHPFYHALIAQPSLLDFTVVASGNLPRAGFVAKPMVPLVCAHSANQGSICRAEFSFPFLIVGLYECPALEVYLPGFGVMGMP